MTFYDFLIRQFKKKRKIRILEHCRDSVGPSPNDGAAGSPLKSRIGKKQASP